MDDTNLGTLTVWQSGRLAPRASARRFEFAFTREQWIVAGLLLLSAIVLSVYVAVLERDVDHSEMAHLAQRARALAVAQCEAGQPAGQHARSSAATDDDVATASARPATATDPRAMTVSLGGDR